MKLVLYYVIYSYSHRTNYYGTYAIFYSKTILYVYLITEVPPINLALYFAVISDSVNKRILGDHLLTITIATLSNPDVQASKNFYSTF